VSSTLNGAPELVAALEAGALTDDVQMRLQQILVKIAAGDPTVQPLVNGIGTQSTAAKQAVTQLIAEVGAGAFTFVGAGRAASDLAKAAAALDAAIALVAHAAGNMDDPVAANQRPAIEAAARRSRTMGRAASGARRRRARLRLVGDRSSGSMARRVSSRRCSRATRRRRNWHSS
jgi:hypothetical protein